MTTFHTCKSSRPPVRGHPVPPRNLARAELSLDLTENAGVVVYKVMARRAGSAPYAALISSTYVHEDGAWRLAVRPGAGPEWAGRFGSQISGCKKNGCQSIGQ